MIKLAFFQSELRRYIEQTEEGNMNKQKLDKAIEKYIDRFKDSKEYKELLKEEKDNDKVRMLSSIDVNESYYVITSDERVVRTTNISSSRDLISSNNMNVYSTKIKAEKILKIKQKYQLDKLANINAILASVFEEMENEENWNMSESPSYLNWSLEYSRLVVSHGEYLPIGTITSRLVLDSTEVIKEVKRRMGEYWTELENTYKKLYVVNK